MADRLRVLVVEDDERVREVMAEALSAWEYEVATARTGTEALDLLRHRLFDTVLCDIRLPEMDGLELLREVRQRDPAVEVVMVTAYPAVSSAVEALKLGAYDYLAKPVSLNELRHLMARVAERRFLRREVSSLRSRLGEQLPSEIVGASPQIERIRGLVARVAPTDSPVLIEGESGTGKDLVASALHRLSARRQGPFIPVNCGAVPAELLESEFFGHVRGAFSGAVADHLGLFRSASGGTLFLDEVTELPPALQVKLLRVLEEKQVRPVGSARTCAADVRVVAATNRPVEEAVREGVLRQDFFYRLNVVRIVMPPLRERAGDIPALVAYFLRQLNERFGRDVRGIAPDAMAALMAYDFPGNVRELLHLLERAYALGARSEITVADLPMLTGSALRLGRDRELPTLAQTERELILRALQVHGNDKERAARALGLSRRTIYRRLKQYGLL